MMLSCPFSETKMIQYSANLVWGPLKPSRLEGEKVPCAQLSNHRTSLHIYLLEILMSVVDIAAKKVVDKNATLETAKAVKEATDRGNEELKYLQKKFVSNLLFYFNLLMLF